jgi:FRG domain
VEIDNVSISECLNGVTVVNLGSWKNFHSFIINSTLIKKNCIFRGQRDSSWKLEPTLDRLAHKYGKKLNEEMVKDHLKNFSNAKKGKYQHSANEFGGFVLWGLGQHHGLATPLLDWTESPFIASYFAFYSENSENHNDRAIYMLDKNLINDIDNYPDPHRIYKQFPALEISDGYLDSNQRMIAQRGVFVKCPTGMDIETYVKTRFEGVNKTVLMKILIPENGNDRKMFLKHLNKMNISHLTLFPDLEGASIYSNMIFEIDDY